MISYLINKISYMLYKISYIFKTYNILDILYFILRHFVENDPSIFNSVHIILRFIPKNVVGPLKILFDPISPE